MATRVLPKSARIGVRRRGSGFLSPMKRLLVQSGFAAIACTAGLIASITPVADPALNGEHQTDAPLALASITYSGSQISIQGSVENLFQSNSFVGPNRDLKSDRLLPNVDVVEVATSFVTERTRIAALRTTPSDPITNRQSPAPILGQPVIVDTAPRISLAAIDPALASAALSAIENVTPVDPNLPMPNSLSEQLAYSRANTPTTQRAVSQYSERERWCLATGIYFEARGETYRGQVGVAQVIMNRVKHRQYPDSICGVVFQNQTWKNRCQFSFACDGIPERVNDTASWNVAKEITEKVTDGSLYLAEVANATHYHANYVYPHWAPRMTRLTRIGAHIFYRFRS